MVRKRRIDREHAELAAEGFTKRPKLPPLLVQLMLFGQTEAIIEINDPRQAFVQVFNEENRGTGAEARPL